jgi:hypothetical protein
MLADAQTAATRKPVNREEAIEIAAANFNDSPVLKSVDPTNTTIYVSSEFGRVESFRNNKWRLFDFLWMMHMMDL